jgi:hypothetical protein
MLEAKEREIDGIVFRYQPMTATPARKLFDELVQRFGPALGAALGGIDDLPAPENGATEVQLGAITGALGIGISDFSKALEPEFHAKLVERLGEKTEFQNDQGFVKFDEANREVMFGTKLATELKWILFCLEVQFSDFLDLFQEAISGTVSTKVLMPLS